MRKILMAKIPSAYDEALFQEYCAKVDSERLAQTLRIGPEQSRMRSLFAGHLLQCGVKAMLLSGEAGDTNEDKAMKGSATGSSVIKSEIIVSKIAEHDGAVDKTAENGATKSNASEREIPLPLTYRYGAFGKPYLLNYPEIFFNLSHSGRFVVCGVDKQEIGVDIQEETPVKDRLAERFFTPAEYRELQALTDEKAKQKLFFRLWAVKESYLKLTGRGIGQGLNTFRIDWEQGKIDDFTHQCEARFEIWEIEPGVHLAVCG